MAYMSQEKKKSIVAAMKPVLKKYGIKATFGVRHHSTLVMNISSGNIDFIANFNETTKDRVQFRPAESYVDVNPYWYKEHFSGVALKFMEEAFPILNDGNFDHSDIQSDYFHVGWYVDVNVGSWNKPYIFNGE